MTLVTANVKSVTGDDDKTYWTFFTVLREGADGDSIITAEKEVVKPVNGVLSVDLEPGTVAVRHNGETYWISVPADGPVDLWDLLEVSVAVPPTTSADVIADAISAYVTANPFEVVDDPSPQLGGNLDLNSRTVGAANSDDLAKLHSAGTLSGNNTGDQDLSAYATSASVASDYQAKDDELTALAALTDPAGKLTGIAAGATANDTDANLKNRANHTGTQSADTIVDGSTNHVFTAADDTKLGGIATGATANDTDANLRARSSHTGTQSADTITDGTTNKSYTAVEKTKLSGVATGATANSSDATLLARANHTGSQSSSTISDFTEAVQDAVGTLLQQGTNVTLTYNDAANTLTIDSTASGGLDAEAVRDAIGVAIVGLGVVSVTVNDGADTITISSTATVNDTDANLKDRANHTGTQLASTISNLGTVTQARFMTGTSATAGATAAKTVTLDSPWAAATPAAGDWFFITLTNGNSVNSPTLAINGSTARAIRTAAAGTTTAHTTVVAGGSVLMQFDGTNLNLSGATQNTTYAEVSQAEIVDTAQSSQRTITGRRAEDLLVNEATKTRTLTNKTLTSPVINTPTGIVKGDVGLGNVDNTSDANKPVSTATQTALNLKQDADSDLTALAALTAPATKLSGIATGATANDTDANLKNRANHTGTQTISTISDVTAFARTFLDDADATAVRATLGVSISGPAAHAASELISRMDIRPTVARRALIETLITSLITNGIWDKLDALYVFAAHHAQAAKLNWAGGAQDATAVNAPVFQVDRGFTGDGSAAYLDTNTVGTELERYGANDASFGGYVRTSVSSATNFLGGATGNTTYLLPNNAGNTVARANIGTGTAVTVSNSGDSTGLFAWTRDATTLTIYKDGTSIGSGAVNTGGLPTSTFTFLKQSTNYTTHQLAAGFISQGLTGTQHGQLNTALAAYLTAVGANV